MDLTPERLHAALGSREFRFLPTVTSTQDIAQTWLLADAPPGALVIGDEQTAGRGRSERVWHTPPGVALALSVVLRPSLAALGQVTMLGGLAVAEMLDGIGVTDIGIKWPNDVQLAGRKVSGVLPEAVWEGGRLRGVALGIGVNVRVDFAGTNLEATATSIEPALGRSLDRADLISRLMDRVDHWSAWLGTPALFRAWERRLNTIGRAVTINGVTGIAEAVDADGALRVRDGAGALHRMVAGEIVPGT